MEASEEHTSEQSTPCEPVVAYLGPQSSYTHQVVDLYRRQIPAWSIGLTCLDFAKATIQRFHKTNFVLEPYGSIEGTKPIMPKWHHASNLQLPRYL